ncbi:hypothetical protein KFE25_012456 [Diacronema lutheri]|uniref:Uncharacterized protein n=2 Tax=Diacronema lutheri TaxID=2081491 RepID=A0A8J5XDZ1_DIALT|nr:hypothetical protein KFE25_012456 [Diacronema lutheri]
MSDTLVEVVLCATIIWSCYHADVVLTPAEAASAAHHRSHVLNVSSAALAAFSSAASILLVLGERRTDSQRARRASMLVMPAVVALGLIGALLGGLGADLGLLLLPCCQGVLPLQRLANSACAVASAAALGALRILTLFRWREQARMPLLGTPVSGDAAGGGDASSADATSPIARADAQAVGTKRRAPPLPRMTVPLWIVVEWSLTVGAIRTNSLGSVICSDFLQSCAGGHNFLFDFCVFVAWPVGSLVAATMVLANQLGRRGGCAPCQGKCERTTVLGIARGQVVLAVAQLAVVSANEVLGSSAAFVTQGAQLQLGPGIGALGLHVALALVRLRWTALAIASMEML